MRFANRGTDDADAEQLRQAVIERFREIVESKDPRALESLQDHLEPSEAGSLLAHADAMTEKGYFGLPTYYRLK
jgi:hypothetical protein